MVFGGGTTEKLLLNHEWLYRAVNRYRNQAPKAHYLDNIRKLFTEGAAGDLREYSASSYANEILGGTGGVLRPLLGIKNRVDPYQPVGHLHIEYADIEAGAHRKRSLDLRDGGRSSIDVLEGKVDSAAIEDRRRQPANYRSYPIT